MMGGVGQSVCNCQWFLHEGRGEHFQKVYGIVFGCNHGCGLILVGEE